MLNSFDALETTLRELAEILERNHSQQIETCSLVKQMTKLVDEMKSKTSRRGGNFVPSVGALTK